MVILTTYQPPESPILWEQGNTRAILDNKDLELGTLYISERTFCWKDQEGLGFCIEYPHIFMHTVTNRSNHLLHPMRVYNSGHTYNRGLESQLLIIPSEAGGIPAIYTALNECQTLNPDPEDIIEEDDNISEDAEDFGTNKPAYDLGAAGDSDVGHLSAQLRNHSLQGGNGNGDQNFDDDQFEDAD